MTSNRKDPSHQETHATDADAAKAVDGPAQVDFAASDMAHAVEQAQDEHHREDGRDAEAAKVVDGASDYPSSDMAHAVKRAEGKE